MNQHLRTVIVAPMTTSGRAYPWRVACRFQKRDGSIVLDQIRTVDRERLIRKLGRLAPPALAETLALLHELFIPWPLPSPAFPDEHEGSRLRGPYSKAE